MSARRAREGKLRPIRRTQAARRTLRALRVDLEAFAEEVLDLAEVAVASRLVQLGVRRHKAARAARRAANSTTKSQTAFESRVDLAIVR